MKCYVSYVPVGKSIEEKYNKVDAYFVWKATKRFTYCDEGMWEIHKILLSFQGNFTLFYILDMYLSSPVCQSNQLLLKTNIGINQLHKTENLYYFQE